MAVGVAVDAAVSVAAIGTADADHGLAFAELGLAAGDSGAVSGSARFLYTLMMMLRWPATGAGFPYSQTPSPELDTRRIAQWAINAVTFATNDSIMVPFKYDPNVFQKEKDTSGNYSYGWHLWDDDITANSQDAAAGTPFRRRLGCKPPELLLTEAVAFHDRRVADTQWNAENPGKSRTDANTAGTAAVDYLQQTRIPQGSLFVETSYCPRAAPIRPRRQTSTSPSQAAGLDLDKMATGPSTDGQTYPVWRLVISQGTITSANNDVRSRLWQFPDSSAIEPAADHVHHRHGGAVQPVVYGHCAHVPERPDRPDSLADLAGDADEP